VTTHTVEEGDCICSIAAEHGVSWAAIHDLEDNDDLFGEKHCNLLEPGDEVALPEPEPAPEEGSEQVATNRRHTFVVRGLTTLRLRLHVDGEPLAGEAWRLEVGERTLRGATDEEGLLRAVISPAEKTATLVLEGRNEQVTLRLGALHPPDTDTAWGVGARLQNLGLLDTALRVRKPSRPARGCQRAGAGEGGRVGGRQGLRSEDVLDALDLDHPLAPELELVRRRLVNALVDLLGQLSELLGEQ